MNEIVITTPDDAREVYRHKQLRQALYDAGEVVMEDVVVNLHGDEHRQRRRLENRLFRRDTFYEYEREMFPAIIQQTVDPYLTEGKAELVDFGHQLMMNLAALTAGVDRPLGTYEETSRLYDYLTTFIEGAAGQWLQQFLLMLTMQLETVIEAGQCLIQQLLTIQLETVVPIQEK